MLAKKVRFSTHIEIFEVLFCSINNLKFSEKLIYLLVDGILTIFYKKISHFADPNDLRKYGFIENNYIYLNKTHLNTCMTIFGVMVFFSPKKIKGLA